MDETPRLTRRAALGGIAVAGAGLVLGPAVARATAPASPGALTRVALGDLAPRVVRRVRLGSPVALAAVTWRGPGRAGVELRARRSDGSFGPWASAGAIGHEGDGVRPSQPIGEGVLVGATRELELRSARGLRAAELALVPAEPVGADGEASSRSRRESVAAVLPRVAPALPAGPGQPPIIVRSAWAHAGQRPTHSPLYGSVELAFVHHTESPNGYGPDEVPAMLRSIWSFHVHGRGWWDIGYNFLVDRFGRIWEGRAGGTTLPVVGAQAGDWNTVSTGVALLGTYSDALPSPAALDALERLLAWKLSLHGRPARGEVPLVVSGSDVSFTAFRTGEHVSLPRIAGHRQGDATACPGDVLFDHLETVRGAADRLAGDPATLTVSAELSELAVGGPALTLAGSLTRLGGGAMPGAGLVVEQVVGEAGATRPLATATTGADGRYLVTVRPHVGGAVRVLHAAAPAVVSELVGLERAG